MKYILIFLMAGGLLWPGISRSAETAQARLYCLSAQFQQATATSVYDGFYWRLNLTTLASGDNGELAPQFLTTSYTHSAYVDLYSELYGETDPGAIALNVPANDANGDGFPDFF
ncbi:MAG: hypothetical protein KGJ60_09755 [Verrucomicrobiota bacterium]|nr:hypothetical protein [Verrucomicrobiota bacterium]